MLTITPCSTTEIHSAFSDSDGFNLANNALTASSAAEQCHDEYVIAIRNNPEASEGGKSFREATSLLQIAEGQGDNKL